MMVPRRVGIGRTGGRLLFPFNIPPFHPLQKEKGGEERKRGGGRGFEEAIRLVIRSRQDTRTEMAAAAVGEAATGGGKVRH